MRTGRNPKKRGWPKRRKPSKEVRDLLGDFGTTERQNGSVWLMLDLGSLPDYLRKTRAAQEARRWVGVFSPDGRIGRYFERKCGPGRGLQGA